jgi:hypothetical protein
MQVSATHALRLVTFRTFRIMQCDANLGMNYTEAVLTEWTERAVLEQA